MVMPGDDAARMAQPERFWPMLSRWLDPRDVQSVERSAVYTFHSLIARGWRDARLLLAGDACHQTPPFLGQGMCAGIRDAANLSWKLAAVLRGKAAPALLDSYETERRPHVETFIQLAVKLGDIIQTTDPAVAAERDRRFAAGDPALLEVPSPLLGPGAHAEGGWPHGSILPQPRTPDGRLWDEVTAGWFCVIGERALLNAADEETCAIWRRLDARVHAVDVTPDARRLLDLTGAAALILRPDAYVFGTAKDAAGLMSLSRQLPVKLHLA
jgi:3-(3-hydroxy-phenyl)propionate hydroxylase